MAVEITALTDIATVWPRLGSNGFGGHLFGIPKLVNARWHEYLAFLTRVEEDAQISNAKIYVSEDISEGDYIALGNHIAIEDPSSFDDAYQIERFQRQTDLRGLRSVRWVTL